MSSDDSLYERLGGREAIDAVVNRFYERVLADESLEHYFTGTDMQRLRTHQARFLVAAFGGPDEYAGANVRDAHEHLDVRPEHFDAVAGHLRATLEEFDIDNEAVEEVMATVGGLREDVLDH